MYFLGIYVIVEGYGWYYTNIPNIILKEYNTYWVIDITVRFSPHEHSSFLPPSLFSSRLSSAQSITRIHCFNLVLEWEDRRASVLPILLMLVGPGLTLAAIQTHQSMVKNVRFQ